MVKYNKSDYIFMILLAVEMFSLLQVFITRSRVYAIISCVVYGVILFYAFFMWCYYTRQLEKMTDKNKKKEVK